MKYEEILEKFVCSPSRVAVMGASPKEDRPVFRVMNYLKGVGFTLYPVNPRYDGKEVLGRPCASALKDVDRPVDVVALFLSAKGQGAVAEDLEDLPGRPVVWFQPGAENDVLAAELEGKGYSVVRSDCLMAAHMEKCR